MFDSASCVVVLGASEQGMGPGRASKSPTAIDYNVKMREEGFPVIPVLLPGVEWSDEKLPAFLKQFGHVAFEQSLDDSNALYLLACGIKRIRPGPLPGTKIVESEEPYWGLSSSRRSTHRSSSAASGSREVLVEPPSGVHCQRAGERLLAVMGPSGSGKSSVVRAEAVPSWARRLPGSDSWPVAVVKPGSQPLESLANAIDTVRQQVNPLVDVYDRVAKQQDGTRSLHVAARSILGEPPRAEQMIVVVDQFEQIFTLCSKPGLRVAFINNLIEAAIEPGGPVIIVLTMRADFYGHCAGHRGLADLMGRRQKLVGLMNAEELRWAIEKPAQRCGGTLEAGLVELLLRDALARVRPALASAEAREHPPVEQVVETEQPGHLPLLEFALGELWKRQVGGRLTVGAYEKIGGLQVPAR